MRTFTEFRVFNISGTDLEFTDNLGGLVIANAAGYVDLLGLGYQEYELAASDDLQRFVDEQKIVVLDQFLQPIDVFNMRQIWALAGEEQGQNDRLSTLETSVSNIENTILDLQAKDAAIDIKDFEQDTRLDLLQDGQSAHGVRLTAIDVLNTVQSNRLTVIETKNDAQDTRLTIAEGTLLGHSGQLATIEADNIAQAARILSTETVNTTQAGQIAAINTKDTQHDAKILAIETDVAAKTLRIIALETANAAKTAQIATLQSEVALLKQWQGGVILQKTTTWTTQSTFMGIEYLLTGSNAGLNLTFATGNLQDGDKCIVNNARTTTTTAKLTTGFSLDIPVGRHWVTYNKTAGTLTRTSI